MEAWETRAREELAVLDRLGVTDSYTETVRGPLKEIDSLRAAMTRSEDTINATRTAYDVLHRKRNRLLEQLSEVEAGRDDAKARAAEAEREIDRAREALGYGADDARWLPGETSVAALIRDRDRLRVELATTEAERDHAMAQARRGVEWDHAIEDAIGIARCDFWYERVLEAVASLPTLRTENDRLRGIVEVVARATSAEPNHVVDAVVSLGARLARERAAHARTLRGWAATYRRHGEHDTARTIDENADAIERVEHE